MTPEQFFSSLRDSLRALVWPSSTNRVLGDAVRVVAELPMESLQEYPRDSAFIMDMGGQSYSEHDELFIQHFRLVLFHENFNDRYGESVMLGSGEEADTTRGVGIFKIDQVITNHVRSLTTLGSRKVTIKRKSKPRIVNVKGNNQSIFRAYDFKCLLSYDEGTDPDHNDILRSPGFLYHNPTNIPSGDFGDKLGFVKTGVLFDPGFKVESLPLMDSGIEPVLDIYEGNDSTIIADLINYNATTIARIFPGMTTSNRVNMNLTTGTLLNESIASGLVFVPDDLVNNMVVFFPKATPFMFSNTRISRQEDIVFRCIFKARRKSGQMVYIGPQADAPVV